jgi:hypothetical protein
MSSRTDVLRKTIVAGRTKPAAVTAAVRGLLAGLTEDGEPLVDFCGNTSGRAVAALTTVGLQSSDVGAETVLLFEDGDPNRPIIVGLVRAPSQAQPPTTLDVAIDGKRLVLSAEQEIVLQCGEASITLTRSGRVSVKGAYVLSRSTGVNRIQGGSVQLN